MLSVHPGQHLIEMSLAKHQRLLPRGQDCAADESLAVGSRHAFGGRDYGGRAAVERHAASVEPQQLFPAYRVWPGDLDREVHSARPVGEGVRDLTRALGLEPDKRGG